MSVFSTGQNIYLRQGDTGNISFSGLPVDEDYGVFLSIYNPDNDRILKEIEAASFDRETGIALFTFNEEFSNSLPVGDWTYGLKICANGTEDTLLPRAYIDDSGDLIKESAPQFTVDYKYVEGD